MTIKIIGPVQALTIVRPQKGLRINAGGPGLRGLPGGAGANGIFAGTEADIQVKSTDKTAVVSNGNPYMAQARKASPWTLFG